MPFMRVALDGVHVGQNIVNILYYRTTSPIPSVLDFLGYAEAIAAEVLANIWHASGATSLQEQQPTTYTLQNITVSGIDEDGLALTTTPYVLPVNEAGERAQTSDSSALVVIMKANLEPAFGPGTGLPKRGYLAIGPVTSDRIENNGLLTEGGLDAFNDLGVVLAQNIVTELPPGTFYPVRLRFNPSGLPFPVGYRDVSSFVPRQRVSWRRSRNNVGEE